MNLEKALHHYFGYTSFRPGQKEIIAPILEGESVFGMLPTGTGKTLCYQLAGYLMEGTVLIISPLISLMEDQVTQLSLNGEKRGIALNSLLSKGEKQFVLRHLASYKFVFMSPEMFLAEPVQTALKQLKVAFLVVDEAHCISQWGVDFRPEYLKLAEGIQQLNISPVLALTATATQAVRGDIQHLLFQRSVKEVIHPVDRPNIRLFVRQGEKMQQLNALVSSLSGAGIIYCATRKQVERIYHAIKQSESVAYYHGGLTGQERRMLQQQFLTGKLRLLIATNAFGMGINKEDIRFVIHYDLPASPEDYLQEIGRAGRDGKTSQAILLYNEGDEKIHYFLQNQTAEAKRLFQTKQKEAIQEPLVQKWQHFFADRSDELLQLLERKEKTKHNQLKSMLAYIQTENCRREFLIHYFDQQLIRKPQVCCDLDHAELIEDYTQIQKEQEVASWQSILKKLVKIK
ncbi:ATP-dependent DNA helicase [Enterococcus florum]|uniref:ATP-dependent DNA helicase RecQ n=1 Tax=Enterococcus florum TaxID=2480627 RepID=A0A4P5P9X5_9ENTE|nr:ATP-dependent DNA helicase RecQ [Enterococcus florum]GCF92788.1 ATP-dependent DNA helicase [Enterococcus florum]